MFLRMTGQTILAAIVIALLAAGWQMMTRSGVAGVGGPATVEQVHHDDD
ncbi:MAG: hypothetical protein HC834_11175 [Rhodospirillales bacterium]|nr:hypothetical protein [Rhodospirillales bacterium]